MGKKLSFISILMVSTFFFILFFFTYSAMGAVQEVENRRKILNKVYSLQIPFIENKGQIKDESVRYYAKTMGGTLFITKDGEMVYSLPLFINPPQWSSKKRTPQGRQSETHPSGVAKKTIHRAVNPKCEGWVIKESFVGASISQVKGEGKAITKVGYFKGKDTSKWRRNIPTYNLVSLGEIYGGIELKLKAYGNNVEKFFYVKAGTNSELIKVKIEGSKTLKVNEKGELEVETGLGVVKFTKPVAYQEDNGKKKHIEVAYSIKGHEYGFKVGNYDRTKELVIDPLLASTFLGDGGDDRTTHSIAVDSSGNIYIAGETDSSEFPTTLGAYDTIYSGGGYYGDDAFISKLDGNLQNLLASTFLGGVWSDWASSISIDNSGNVYVTGGTNSSDFPTTPGAYDTTPPEYGYDVFVAKLDGNLQNLLASTFLGGVQNDDAYSISIDSSGNVYVGGKTRSTWFPTTPNAYDPTHNGIDANTFVSKLDASLENLLASTFLGDYGWARSIITDDGGNVYVAGEIYSSDFPTTPGAYDTTFNGRDDYDGDAFVSKLDSNLENLLASTFLGGVVGDHADSVAIDSIGNVYVAGITRSSDFPTTAGAYGTTLFGANDAFVSKLDSNLESLLASTFFGGNDRDSANSIYIDSIGNVYVAGETYSSDFPTTPDNYDTSYNGGADVFISKLDSDLSVAQPDISISPISHNFGSVNIGSTSTQTFTVTNIGNGDLGVGSLSITGTDASEFEIQSDNCSEQTIAPSGNCTVDVLFSPVSEGAKSATLSIPSNDPDTPILDAPLYGEEIVTVWSMFHYDAQHTGRSPFTGPHDDAILWVYDGMFDEVNSSPAIDKSGTIYVGSEDYKLYALNADGTLKWTYATGGGIKSSPAIGYDGTIYVGSRDHNLYAIKPDGILKWLYTTGGEISAPATIGHDGTIYVGSHDRKLYALNSDGTLKCEYNAGGVIASSPAIGPDGIIYVGSSNGRLNALYPDCTLKWESDPPIHGIWTHPALSPDGTAVYHGADDGYFYARNTSDGSVKWKSPYTYGGIQSSPAIGGDGTIYVGTQYGNLWAINPEDGSLKWDYYMTLSARSSPAIGTDGTVYFATCYGHVYAMNEDGTVKWIYSGNFDDDGHFYSSPAIGSNGALYIGSTKDKLYAFGKPPCKADFDHDGDVDGSDLAIFAADFGRTNCHSGDPCEGNFDEDNDVDGSDLAVFAADFGRTDCP